MRGARCQVGVAVSKQHDLELQRISAGSVKFAQVIGLLKHAITMAVFAFCVHLFMTGLNQMVGNDADSLKALGFVIEKMKFGDILGYLGTIGAGTGWYYERKGKKRAYARLGKNRAIDECDDPYSASSHLGPDGQTPK